MIAFPSYSLEPRLHQKTENCFVQSPRKKSPSLSWLYDEGREGRTIWQPGNSGSREVELECLKTKQQLDWCLGFGSCSRVLLSAACMPPFWTSSKSVGWLLWELMGAAGSGRRKVLGIDSKIIGEQSFSPPPGFPAYRSWA